MIAAAHYFDRTKQFGAHFGFQDIAKCTGVQRPIDMIGRVASGEGKNADFRRVADYAFFAANPTIFMLSSRYKRAANPSRTIP